MSKSDWTDWVDVLRTLRRMGPLCAGSGINRATARALVARGCVVMDGSIAILTGVGRQRADTHISPAGTRALCGAPIECELLQRVLDEPTCVDCQRIDRACDEIVAGTSKQGGETR